MSRLRNRRVVALAELNAAIRQLLDELNTRMMRGDGASRANLFATLDRPHLQVLPEQAYEFARRKRARVAPYYHVEVDSSWYSVPFGLIRQEVDVRVCGATVEVFHRGSRVASHPRCPGRRSHVTVPEHVPSAHRRHAEWTPARMLEAATKLGPSVAAFCEAVMADRPHPEQGFRTCLGVLALAKSFDADRVDAACRGGLSNGAARSPRYDPSCRPGSIGPSLKTSPRGSRCSIPTSVAKATIIERRLTLLTYPTSERLAALGLTGTAERSPITGCPACSRRSPSQGEMVDMPECSS